MRRKPATVRRALTGIVLAACVFMGMLPLGAVKANALTPSYPVSSSYASGLYYPNLTKVALTGDQREDMVNIALSQVGYKEGSKENDYSGADDGAYKNYTEYNSWYHDHVSIGMPAGGEGAPWCATFLSWCAAQAGIPRDVIKPSVRASLGIDAFDIDFYSGSDTLNRTADDNEHFKGYNYTPRRGDLFFTRKWTHVGIVVGVSGDTVITVEGNTNDDGSDNGYGVYLHTDRKIQDLYFGVPDYAVHTPTAAPGKPVVSTDKAAYTCGEMANITWDTAADATSYRVEILRDGEPVVSRDLGAVLAYSYAPNVPGSYSVCVTAANALGSTASEVVSFTASRKDAAISGVSRLAGETRYDTALKAANEVKKQLGIGKFSAILVASGENFADALSGSYLASVKNAPILLVKDRAEELSRVKNYIRANLAPGGTVYLLGGETAVPKKMESGLQGFTVKRLGGTTRFDTNAAILQEAGLTQNQQILVATGYHFADSLSASAVGLPILLVNTENGKLAPAQKELLRSLGGCKLTIVGGENAVSSRVETMLHAYGPTERLAGRNRYETSILVARRYFTAPGAATLAYGKNFPDGLCGGPLAYICKTPLILTEHGKEEAAAEYVSGLGVRSGYVLGGTSVLPEKTVNKVFGK